MRTAIASRMAVLVALLVLVPSAAAPTITPTLVPACSGGQWTQAQARVASAQPITRTSMRYTYRGLTVCATSRAYGGFADGGGTAAVFLSLAPRGGRTDPTISGSLVQLGIYRWGTGAASFIYMADNTGGGGGLFSAPYPVLGHAYTFAISLDRARWRLRITDESSGVVVHELYEPAHWQRAAVAWAMFESYDHASPFPPGSIASFTVNGEPTQPGCLTRDISARPSPLTFYVASPTTARCTVGPVGFAATR